MKNTFLVLTVLISSQNLFAASGSITTISIKPSIVRDDPVPQVFVDGGGTYYISTQDTTAYNNVMNQLNYSLQSHKAASYRVDVKTNTIVDTEAGAKAETISVYEPDDSTTASNSSSSSPSGSTSGSTLGKMPINTGASAVPGAGVNTGAMGQNH